MPLSDSPPQACANVSFLENTWRSAYHCPRFFDHSCPCDYCWQVYTFSSGAKYVGAIRNGKMHGVYPTACASSHAAIHACPAMQHWFWLGVLTPALNFISSPLRPANRVWIVRRSFREQVHRRLEGWHAAWPGRMRDSRRRAIHGILRRGSAKRQGCV